MANIKIIAYLKPVCGWSNGVRAVLQKYKLPYEDRDIINNQTDFNEMVRKTGQRLSPSVEIDGKVLADVSGDEVEAYLVSSGLIKQSDAPPPPRQTEPVTPTESRDLLTTSHN